MTFSHFTAHTAPIRKNLTIFTVRETWIIQTVIILYKYVKNITHNTGYLKFYQNTARDDGSRVLRSQNAFGMNLKIPTYSSHYEKTRFTVIGPLIWNEVKITLNEYKLSILSFKQNLKKKNIADIIIP